MSSSDDRWNFALGCAVVFYAGIAAICQTVTWIAYIVTYLCWKADP